jgi:hypothetical protein
MIEERSLEGAVCTAIGAYPGNMVTGQSPGVFQYTGGADLKSAGAGPAKLFPLTAAMAFKSSFGPSGFRARIGLGVI